MKTKVLLTIVLVILTTCTTFAQENENRFAVELNVDVIFVSTELNGATLNTGLGFEAILQYRVLPFTSLYGGWGRNQSNAEESFAGENYKLDHRYVSVRIGMAKSF